MTLTIQQIAPLFPELFLAIAAMALLLLGVFSLGNPSRMISWLSIAALVVALFVMGNQSTGRTVVLSGMFIVDGFAVFMKSLVLIGAASALLLSHGYLRQNGMERFEYSILVLLATVGMMMMVSANDLIALYLGLELQSLSLYVVAAFRRDSERATEAGLKYFVLGALSSGLLLYGSSLVYGFAGSTNFEALAQHFDKAHGHASLGIVVGIVFIAAGLAFKVSAVPFHMWTPDVYEGAPTPVTAFFAAAPKVAAMALFVRVMVAPFGDLLPEWRQIVWVIAAASMILGAFAAIQQKNIKRLMAYSSIGHVGYALLGLAAGTPEGVRAVVIYMAIYLAMTLGAFACILAMQRKHEMVESIDDLAGLNRTRPGMAFALAVFMFSLAGVPPLAGFFGKFYVFMAAVNAHLYVLAVIGAMASVVGAFYYLRIVKLMYFDEPALAFEPMRGELAVVATVSTLFTLLFVFYPVPILAGAATAAKALFP